MSHLMREFPINHKEFMLVCNETVAEFMTWNEMPFVYRIHEEPEVEKMLEFNEFIHNFGHRLKNISGEIHPKALQNLFRKIKGSKEEGIISTVMLRSLKKLNIASEMQDTLVWPPGSTVILLHPSDAIPILLSTGL